MNAHGTVHKYGDNVDTDVIIPARYLNTASHQELASHCMEDIDKNFVSNVKPGDIIVAEKNFGCGSSREHAPIAIKASGISCVIASTFARIFYRNAINIGLAILECDEAATVSYTHLDVYKRQDPEQAALAFICKRLKLNLKKLSEEEKKWLKKIAQKSDLLKNPNPQRGRK